MCVLIYFYIKLEPSQIYIILCVTCSSSVLEYTQMFQSAIHLWCFVVRLFKIINNEVGTQEKAEYIATVVFLCSRLCYND